MVQAVSLEFKGTGSMDDNALFMAIAGDNSETPYYDYSQYHNLNTSVLGNPSQINDREIAKWYGALNFSGLSGDGVLYDLNDSIDDDMTGLACNFWVYHTTEPTGANSQYYYWAGTSDSDNQHTQQGDYGVETNWDTTNGTTGGATGESNSDTTGYWSWIHSQYDDQTERFKMWRNDNLVQDYTDTGAGNITWADNYTFRLAYGDYNIDLHGYIDELFCYNRGNFTNDEVIAEYRLKAQGTPPDLNLLALSDSIPDTSVLYDFSGSVIGLNTTGTIPYTINVSNEGITENSTDFNVTFTIDKVEYTNGTTLTLNSTICNQRIQLDARETMPVTCNITKYPESTIHGHFNIDAFDEIDETLYSGRETDNEQPFYLVQKSFPRLVIPNYEYYEDTLKPIWENSSMPDNIAYTAWNWHRSFVSDPVNPSWTAEDADIRGGKGLENCVNAFINNWTNANSAQQYCLDHLEHWFVDVDDWETGSVQLTHGVSRMVEAFDLVARYLNKTDFDRFGAGMSNVCTDIFGKTNVRPDQDNNNAQPGNGKGFGAGLGTPCIGALGLNPDNPNVIWQYSDKQGYTETIDPWIDRTRRYIGSGKNDKDNVVGEGILYAGYGLFNTVDFMNAVKNMGLDDVAETYNNEVCGRAVEPLWELQDFNYRGDTLRSDQSIYTRWFPFGDSNAYYNLGENGVSGWSLVSYLASQCDDPMYQRASATIRRIAKDNQGNSMATQPTMDLFYYPPIANLTSLTTTELQDNFYSQNAYSFDRAEWRYGNWDYKRGSATLIFEGGEEVGAGHPHAQGLMLYAHVYGEPFIEGVQVPSEDVGRSEKFGNTFNFIDGNYSGGDYWTDCFDAKYYQYYGRNDCSIDTMDDYPDMRFMPENYRGRTLNTFSIPKAEFGSAWGYKPYEGTTEAPKRAVIFLGDSFLTWDRTRMDAERYWEENFINSQSEFTTNTSDNMLVMNRVGTDYRYKIQAIYNDTPIYSRSRSTGEQASNQKTGSPTLNFYYQSNELYNNATTNISLIVQHSWINGTDWSGYTHDNFQSYGDEGVNITTPLQTLDILFDTSESDGLNLDGVTSDGWYLAKWASEDTYASSNFTAMERYFAGTYTAIDASKPITAKWEWNTDNVTMFANSWQISNLGQIDVAEAVTINLDLRELANRTNLSVTKDGVEISSSQVGDVLTFTMNTEKHGSEYIIQSTGGTGESFDLTSAKIKSDKGRRQSTEDLILSWIGTLLDRIIGDWRIGGISFHSINMPWDLSVSPYAIDYSTNGNNGTLSGANWNDAGIKDGSLTLDGTNDYVNLSDDADFDLADNNLSGSMFFYLDTLPDSGTYEALAGKENEWQVRVDENGVASFVIMNETQPSGSSSLSTANLRAYFPLNESSGTTFDDDGQGTYTNAFTSNSGQITFHSGSDCVDNKNCVGTHNTDQALESDGGSGSTALLRENYNKSMLIWAKPHEDSGSWKTLFGANDQMKVIHDGSNNIEGQMRDSGGNWHSIDFGSHADLQDKWNLYMVVWDDTNQQLGVSLNCSSITWNEVGQDEYGASQYTGIGGATKTQDWQNGTYQHAVVYERLFSVSDCEAYRDFTLGTGGSGGEVAHVVNSTATISTGAWYSVQWDYDGTNASIWINGTAKGESAVSGVTMSDTSSDLLIGTYDKTTFIDGKVDEFYLSTHHISDAQAVYYESDGRAGKTLSHIDSEQTAVGDKWTNLVYATDDEFATNDESILSNILQIILGVGYAPFIWIASSAGGAYIVAMIIRRRRPRNRRNRRRRR